MTTRGQSRNAQIFFLWIAIIVLACLVYAAGISHESIWYDEAYSDAMASHSLSQIIRLTTFDNHPPLYYMLLSLARMALGNSEWALRALSVAGAVGLIGLGAGPVRRLFGDKTAFIYAGVVLFTPDILIYAHEARMYTWAIFAVTAGALYGYLAVQSNRTSDWICFGLATLAAAYLHYYGLIAAFFMHLLVFSRLLRKQREHLKAYLITGAAVFAGYLPWLIVFIRQTLNVRKSFWLGPVSLQGVLLAFLQPFAFKEFYPSILPTMYLALLVSVGLIIYGVVMAKRKEAEKEYSLSLSLLFVYLSVVIATILISLFLMPIFYSRYLLVCVGLFLLLTSLGISMLPGKFLPWAAIGIFAFVNVFAIKDIYTQYFNYPMKEMVEELNGGIQPGDLVITSDSYSMGPAVYYFPKAVHYYSNNNTEAQWGSVLKPMIPPLHYEEGLDGLLASHQSFWYISCNTGFSKSISEILQGGKGWEKLQQPITVSEPYSFVAFTAQKYTHTGRVNTGNNGTLTMHVTGLKPIGYLMFALFDKGPVVGKTSPYLYRVINVAGMEASYSFFDLPYGEYVLEVGHDENKNHTVDIDSSTMLPTEGVYILNFDKVDFSKGIEKGLESVTFDLLKFSFNEPDKTIEGKMMYPPFTTGQ